MKAFDLAARLSDTVARKTGNWKYWKTRGPLTRDELKAIRAAVLATIDKELEHAE